MTKITRYRGIDQFQHLEAIQLRHLNIQEHQVRLTLGDGFHGLKSVGALGQDLDAAGLAQIFPKQLPRQFLVVDNHCADDAGTRGFAGPWRRGTAFKVLQVDQQLTSRLIAPVTIFLQALANHAFKLRGQFIVQPAQRLGLRLQESVPASPARSPPENGSLPAAIW